MVYNKKAISPVVATALLLVVAVVAVVGFQTWFNTYQSGLNSKVEQQSNTGSAVTVERLENGTVYLKNSGTSNLNSVTVKAGDCTDSTGVTLAASTVTTVSMAGCDLTTGAEYDVVVITSDGVYQETELAR